MKRTLRIALLLSFACAAVATFSNVAQAQKVDIGFALSGMDAPGISVSSTSDHNPVSLTGGAYLGINGDVLFYHNMGIGAEINWRASQASNVNVTGATYRPLFWNINYVYSPKLMSHVYGELVGGIGSLSTRYYCGTSCYDPYTGTNYVSSNHFDGDFGGGIKLYATKGLFIRPEVRVYVVNNNTDFSSNHNIRYGVTLGYTFR
ncbi:MAG: hypothetical protein ABSG70_11885 [Terriglobales bacterium]